MNSILEKEVYIWVSKEGDPNIDSIGFSIENLYSVTKLHSTGGFFKSLEKHLEEGYTVEKVLLTLTNKNDKN